MADSADSALAIVANIVEMKCGKLHAKLVTKDLLNGRSLCIELDGNLITPCDFQRYGGKESSKNWKSSIRFQDQPLHKFLESYQDVNMRRCYRFKPRTTCQDPCPTEGMTVSAPLGEDHHEVSIQASEICTELLSDHTPCLSDFQPASLPTQQRDSGRRNSFSVPQESSGRLIIS